jgi:hypothetical protein
MTKARQPTITRVSKQGRMECLAMFYANINNNNLELLFCWIHCVTSNHF